MMRHAESILIVDDDSEWREILSEIIKDKYECVRSTDDMECLAEVGRRPYDLITLDISMPHLNGTQLFEKIEAMNLGCHFLVVTQLEPDDSQVEYFRLRDIPVISKDELVDNTEMLAAQISRLRFMEPKELKALIVDDDYENRMIYTSCLTEVGICDIVSVGSIGEAHNILEDHFFDVLVIDLFLRDSQGDLHPAGRDLLASLSESPAERRSFIVLITTHLDASAELDKVPKEMTDARIEIEIDGEISELKRSLEPAVTRWRISNA